MGIFDHPELYDARKMFEPLTDLKTAADAAIEEVRKHLPYTECRYCNGYGNRASGAGDIGLGIRTGDQCRHCLGSGIEVWTPFDLDPLDWLRLVIKGVDGELEFTPTVRAAVITLLAAITAWEDETQAVAPKDGADS